MHQCHQHKKKVEAFCVKDNSPLCIECILEEYHRNHEILSVQKAADRERQTLANSLEKALAAEDLLHSLDNNLTRRKLTDCA